MTARRLLVALAFSALTAPFVADAQPPAKIPRIGFLANIRSPATEGFERGLRELGYVEGQNIAIEWRLVEGKFDRLPDLAAELVRLNVDVIVAPASTYIRAAKKATTTIPIVFALAGDPVAEGVVASLARPGGNITGLSALLTELSAKRLELLREAVRGVTRVAVLATPATNVAVLTETEAAARSMGLELRVVEVRDANKLGSAFSAIVRERAGAVIELPDAMFYAHRRRIADLAIRSRLPMMSAFREFAEAGGLMAYGANIAELLRHSATYVDKILKGAKPADLPVEQASTFELVVNLKTAKALGLTIPRSVLLRADHVIQ